MGGTYPFHFLFFVWSCLPWPSSVSGHIHCGVQYLPASMGINVVPTTLCTCFFQGLQPHHITWGLHLSSVDTLVDIHGWSHNFPFIHPREALLVGHWVTALPLFSCGIHFVSLPTDVVLHGVGPVHLSHVWWFPIHKGTQTSDAMQCVTFHVDLSLFKRGHLSQSDAPPPKSPLSTYPWSSSFP